MKDVILVTGASGLVGNPLIKKLLLGYQVIGLDLRKQTIDSSKYIHLRKKIKKVSDFLKEKLNSSLRSFSLDILWGWKTHTIFSFL